jgi:hypothetical protein
MPCEERLRLVLECTEAAERFSNSAANLNAKKREARGMRNNEQLESAVDDCRAAMEQARRALDRHVSIHGCGEPNLRQRETGG